MANEVDYSQYGHVEDKRLSLQLVATESAVLAAASRIFSGYISSGNIPENEEKKWMLKSIKMAMLMATTVDDAVKAEGEM